MTQLPQKITLPAVMAEKLEVVRRRTLRVRIGTAIVAAVAVLLAAMGIAMLVDWLATIYEFRWRALLTYSAWSAAGATLMAWAAAAWRHTRQVERMAAKVDQEIPDLEERWSTVTELSGSNGTPNSTASVVHPAMFEQVSKEAQSWTPRVEADRVIPLDGLIRALLFLTAITTVLGIAVVLDSQRTTVLMRRFWQPFTPISATELTDLSGDVVVGRGESLEIAANLVGAPVKQASLVLQPTEGEPKTITLVPKGEKQDQLTHRMRAVKEPMQYRMRAGDGQSPWYNIVVADRPKLGDVRVTLTPPAYTRKEAKIINKLPRRVTVLEGSSVEIALKPKQKLKSLELKFSPELSENLAADSEGWYRWRTTLDENISFQAMLTEEHGLSNLRPPTCEIKIRPDRPPVVKILTPNSEMAVRPDDTIPVTFVASDDVGVHQAELIVYDESNQVDGKPAILDRIQVPLGEQQGAVKVKASVKLDLSKYETTDGGQLSFSVRVREDRGQQYLAESQAAQEQSNALTATTNADVEVNADTSNVNAGEQATESTANQMASAAEGEAPGAQPQDPSSPSGASDTVADANAADSRDGSASNAAAAPGASDPAEQMASRSSNAQEAGDATVTAAEDASGATTDESSTHLADNQTTEQPESAAQSRQSNSQDSAAETGNEAASEADSASDLADGDASTDTTTGEDGGKSRTASSARQSLNTGGNATGQQLNSSTAADGSAESSEAGKAMASEGAIEANSGNPDPQNAGGQSNRSSSDNNPSGNNRPQSGEMQTDANDSEGAQGSSGQKSNSSSNMQDSEQTEPQGSSSSPGNPMSRRELDVESAQSSSSQRMRLKIDEWAGSYDGQQRAKLEIAIAPKLEAVDRALEKAEKLSRSVLDDIDEGKPWASQHDRDVQKADEQVEAAIKVIEDLENETYGTPYAFIGLQLVDIKQAHISLARQRLLEIVADQRCSACRLCS